MAGREETASSKVGESQLFDTEDVVEPSGEQNEKSDGKAQDLPTSCGQQSLESLSKEVQRLSGLVERLQQELHDEKEAFAAFKKGVNQQVEQALAAEREKWRVRLENERTGWQKLFQANQAKPSVEVRDKRRIQIQTRKLQTKPKHDSITALEVAGIEDKRKARLHITEAVDRIRQERLHKLSNLPFDPISMIAQNFVDVSCGDDLHPPLYTFEGDDIIQSEGFTFELGNSPSISVTELVHCTPRIVARESDERSYLLHFYNRPHTNYFVEESVLGPLIISVEDETDQQEYRVLVRSEKGTQRVNIRTGKRRREKLQKILGLDVQLKVAREPKLRDELLSLEQQQVNAQRCYKVGVLYAKASQSEDDMFSNVEGSDDFEEFLQFLGDKIKLKDWNNFRGGLDVKHDSTGTHSVYTKFKRFELMFHVSTMLPFSKADEQQLERKRHLGNDIVILVFLDKGARFNPAVIRSQMNYVFIVISKLTADEISKYRDFVIQRRDKLVAYYSNMLVTNRDIEKDKQEHGLTRARSTTDAEKHRRLRLPGADSLRPQSMKIARPTVEVVQKDIVMHEKMHLAALNADVNVPHVSTPDFAPLDAMEEKTFYRVSVCAKEGVKPYHPPNPHPPVFEKDDYFRNFLLTKVINSERAAMCAPDFAEKMQRSRAAQLKELISAFCTKSVRRHAFI